MLPKMLVFLCKGIFMLLVSDVEEAEQVDECCGKQLYLVRFDQKPIHTSFFYKVVR